MSDDRNGFLDLAAWADAGRIAHRARAYRADDLAAEWFEARGRGLEAVLAEAASG